MPKFSHRPSRLPGSDPEKDRVVLCDGRVIGRVRQVEVGHDRAGQWDWNCMSPGTDIGGYCETLASGVASDPVARDAGKLSALATKERAAMTPEEEFLKNSVPGEVYHQHQREEAERLLEQERKKGVFTEGALLPLLGFLLGIGFMAIVLRLVI